LTVVGNRHSGLAGRCERVAPAAPAFPRSYPSRGARGGQPTVWLTGMLLRRAEMCVGAPPSSGGGDVVARPEVPRWRATPSCAVDHAVVFSPTAFFLSVCPVPSPLLPAPPCRASRADGVGAGVFAAKASPACATRPTRASPDPLRRPRVAVAGSPRAVLLFPVPPDLAPTRALIFSPDTPARPSLGRCCCRRHPLCVAARRARLPPLLPRHTPWAPPHNPPPRPLWATETSRGALAAPPTSQP